MIKIINMQGEINTGYGCGFFPVSLKLHVNEDDMLVEWYWENYNNAGKRVWVKAETTTRVRFCKLEFKEKLQKQLA